MPETKTVRLWGRERDLPLDLEDASVIQTFTRGQCHSFARAVHRLTGWPLVVLCHPRREPGGIDRHGDHVVCKAPDGRFVDVMGAWEPGTRWRHLTKHVQVKEVTVMNNLRRDPYEAWDSQNVRAAMPFAELLVGALDISAPYEVGY